MVEGGEWLCTGNVWVWRAPGLLRKRIGKGREEEGIDRDRQG